MATKTAQKPPMEKHEIEKMARMAINALSISLRRNVFSVETDGDAIKVEALDIKAFISRRQIIIMTSFIDIQHNYDKSVIKVYDYEKDDYIHVNADHLRHDLETLLELSKQKVREKLEKALREI